MKTKLLIACCILLSGFTLRSMAVGSWTNLTNSPAKANQGVMILLSDGSVMCVSDTGDQWYRLKPDANGNYATGTWSYLSNTAFNRLYFSSQVLKDGRVYVCGGEYGNGGSDGEIYDPVTNSWFTTPQPGGFVSDANSAILEDGRVLQSIVGGGATTTKIYNPLTNSYSAGPSVVSGDFNESSWVKLPDNSILFVERVSTKSERYIPATNTWIADGIVPVSLYESLGSECGGAFLLPDGRAFFIGGNSNTAYYTPSGNTSPGTWAAGPVIPGSLSAPDAACAMMVNGKILMAVSPYLTCCDPKGKNIFNGPTSFYEFDYLTNTYTQVNAPYGGLTRPGASFVTNMLVLPNGQVLYGEQGQTLYAVYTPDGSPLAAGKPYIDSYSRCGVLTLTGHLFNGISEGSNYGDDWGNVTNYPLVRLTNGANVYYCRTFNWNSTGVQRGSAADTVEFTLPAGLPMGPAYDLVVIANGIASDPISVSDFTILPVPTATASASPNPICSNETLTLTGGPASMSNYAWTGPNGYSNGTQSPTIPNIPVAGSGIYSLEVTNSSGCSNTASTAFVTVNLTPDVNAGPDTTIDGCQQMVQLNGSSTTPGATFHWDASGGGHIFSGENTATPVIDSAGTFTLTVTNPVGGCTATDIALVTIAIPVTCTTCSDQDVTVNGNVTINFNNNPPSYSGDPALLPYFTYSKVGTIKNLWKAIFDVGSNNLIIKNGATITTTQVGGFAPGIVIKGTCHMEVEKGGRIVVLSNNKDAGDILFQINGAVTINGEVRNQVTGTNGLPGYITIDSKCEDITVGQSGLVQDLGIDAGGNNISLLACGTDCNYYGSGNITVAGLVKAYAHAHVPPLTLNRPNIKLVSFNGTVTINANTAEPLYDEFSSNGTLYDIYGGLLSWVRDNANPGKVEVQSRLDITVNGHGTDPTGPVRQTFGAIAARATASNSPGGLVDVRSLQGKIIGNNRAFDVSGRNALSTNFARIRLWSMFNITLSRPGANNNFNPVVNASSPAAGGRGGTNEIRSYRAGVTIGANALVSAAVPPGSGSVQGTNQVTFCTAYSNLGTVTPAAIPVANCVPNTLTAIYTDCFEIGGGTFRTDDEIETSELISEGINVYPNPTMGNVTLLFNSAGADRYSVKVIDLTGRIVINDMVEATEGNNVHEIDLSNAAKGMYILILENANTKEQKRMIVQ